MDDKTQLQKVNTIDSQYIAVIYDTIVHIV